MKSGKRTVVVFASVVGICSTLTAFGSVNLGASPRMPNLEIIFSPGTQIPPEKIGIDGCFSCLPESAGIKVAVRDDTTQQEPIQSDGQSIWELCYENPYLCGGDDGDFDSASGSSNSGGTGGTKRYGGRLFDPARDFKWGDGTICVDCL